MFTQCEDFRGLFEDIKRLDEETGRNYIVDGKPLPSVTSVISFINKDKFIKWRQKVGDQVADLKSRKAAARGTKLHRVLEEYLMNGDYKSLEEFKTPLIQLMFGSAKGQLDSRLNNIYHQETKMSSHRIGVAGTVDLICEVDGELSIVDFKTSAKEKPEEWLEDYFVQLSAYWAMFSERTGMVPKKLVVFLVGENGDVQIVERRNIMNYLMILQDYVSKFIRHRDANT